MGRTGVGTLYLWLCAAVCLAQGQDLVNVAPNKTYSQSSTYISQRSSSMAANGDTSQYFPANCIHTYKRPSPSWFEVNLGRTYPVYNITLWARYNFQRRLNSSIITVDGQTCASITSFPTDTREKTVTCPSVMYGQRVRITRQLFQGLVGDDRTLNLCEIQIWVPLEVSECEAGRYGTSCDMDCNDHCGKGSGNNFCYHSSGYCYDGCVSGWYGDQCSTACSPGCPNTACDPQSGHCSPCNTHYTGDKCSECVDGYYTTSNGTCIQCSALCHEQSCDKPTGKCHGCVDGRHGDMCTDNCQPAHCLLCDQDSGGCTQCTENSNLQLPGCTDCLDDYYKRSDNTGCDACNGTCQSGTVCDKTTGFCPLCPPGKQGHYCKQDCDAGRYGENCTGHCGHCLIKQDTDHCNVVTGHCMHGCQDGWQPLSLCNEECFDGRWGFDCNMTCGQCKGTAACNKRDGQCPLCEPGWKPHRCDTQCDDGQWGFQCNSTCGHCKEGTVCNKTDGQCPLCAPGWYPDKRDKQCADGRWGFECNMTCGQCKEGTVCNEMDGQCPLCEPGWLPPKCDAQCADGFYGEGCNQKCGNCQVSSECRHDTGQCTGLCADDFTGLYCADALQDNNTPVIAGAVVSVLVAILVTVVIVILVMRRRRSQATKSRSSAGESTEMSSNGRDGGARTQRESHGSSTLSFGSVVCTEDQRNVKPQAQVKPRVKPKPNQAETGIYQNVPLPKKQNSAAQPTPARPQQTGEQNGAAREVQRGSPPEGTARPLPRAEKSRGTSREPLTDDEELDSLWSGEAIYANDPSLVFQPTTVRLDQLQKTIVDSLQDGTVVEEFGRLTGVKEYPLTNGERQENYYRNRFMSILPYDKTRVVLEQLDGDDASDYINASFIKGYKTEKAYIASQGPRSNTQDDFWRMVWQEGVTDIVMLTNLKEGTNTKCHDYWPEKGTPLNTGHVEVTGLEEVERAHFIIRTFSVRYLQGKGERQVRQYHYIKWMDHEVPSTTPLVNFWRYVRARAPRTPTAPPLLVHCSAGVGRTGTYIALDILIDQTQEQEDISLYHTVDNLREYRCHMVQNKSQYKFLHEAVLEAYMSGDCRLQTSSFDHVFPSPIHHDQPHPRIDDEFKRLCQMRTCLTRPSHTVASLEENRHKNRNPDALPDDNHLVYITEHSKGRNQYINAVYLPTFLSSRGSIVTQLPLADTVIDLWRLVDSWNVSTIVSIGQVEGGKDMRRYWPKSIGEPTSCGAYAIDVMSMATTGGSLMTYNLDVRKGNQSRELRVLHYEAWTGQVADNVSDLLRLLDTLHTTHTQSTKEPIIIQCIDGVAQSGAVCALWDVISRMTCDGEVDVYQAVRHVHTVRPEAVTSVVQYRFIYEVIQQYRNNNNIYANT